MTLVAYIQAAGLVVQAASIVYLLLVSGRMKRLYRRDMQQFKFEGMQIERERRQALYGRGGLPSFGEGRPVNLPPAGMLH